MTAPLRSRSWDSKAPRLDAARLWAGGLATALVATGVAVVGLLTTHGLLGIPVLTSDRTEPLVNQTFGLLPALAATAALVGTGVLHLLLLSTPGPRLFFGWIVVLALAVIVLQTFMTDLPLDEQVASSLLYVAIGMSILSLLSGVAGSARPSHHDR